MGVYIHIFTNIHIGIEEYAKPFFDLMQQNEFIIEKIGLCEPVKILYTLDDSIRLWVKEEPGLYDIDSNKWIGKAGSMLGKGKGFWFDTAWWLHSSKLSLNYITIYLSKKLFNQKKSRF